MMVVSTSLLKIVWTFGFYENNNITTAVVLQLLNTTLILIIRFMKDYIDIKWKFLRIKSTRYYELLSKQHNDELIS